MLKLAFQIAVCAAVVLGLFIIHSCAKPDAEEAKFDITAIGAAPLVEVGLTRFKGNSQSVTLEGGYQVLVDGRSAGFGEERAVEAAFDGRLRFGSYTAKSELKVIPKSGTFRVGDSGYRGNLILREHRGGLMLVNEIDLENYLAGSVGGELNLARDPREALKAQIIAARTYALYEQKIQRVRKQGWPFDLFDDERSQMYLGMEREKELARELVEETRGLVVTFDNRIVYTFYSSTCGGYTEPAWQVLENGLRTPPLEGVKCDWCAGSKFYEWTGEFDKREMAQKLTGRPGRVVALRVCEKAKHGRALKVAYRLEGEAQERVVHANIEFRRKLGTHVLRSTFFIEIEDLGEKFRITGRGWGHGAGMCQVGACAMAAHGRTAFEILQYYYPGAQVRRIY